MTLKNGKALTIRKAEKGDAAEILAYCKQVGGESDNLLFGAEGLPYTTEQEAQMIDSVNNSHTSTFMVGVVDGKIISVATIFSPPRARIAHQGDIGMSVLKANWGLGVGSHMMQALIDFAKNTGVTEVLHLQVRTDNINAIALYKKYGFEQIGLYPKFGKIDGVYNDDILMNLYL
ncbi:MAG: GNAT family N-acetyltransferase [Defluviitaleaceae bacterium]|nr:GNAT family N-acetyltransferase [Defluviitaleaceae bacterium]